MDDSELPFQPNSTLINKNQMASDDMSLQIEQRINLLNSDPIVNKLSASEQMEFQHICSFFQLADDRNKRNFGMSTFIKHLNLIHHFVVRDDGGDALRGLACGILFGNGFLLVNTDKLKKLTKRSKSCVNGCFQKLGFNVFRETQDLNGFFSKLFPDIDSSLLNSRHWCIRKASDEAPICFIASAPLEVSAKCGFPNETYQRITYPHYPPITQQPQQSNLTNNSQMISFSPPNSSLLNDQLNIKKNLSVNILNSSKPTTENYNNRIPNCNNNIINIIDKQCCLQQPINFQFQQQISQKKQWDQTLKQQQILRPNFSNESSSKPETKNIFFADIKSLLNR